MRKRLIIISYIGIIFGMLALFSVLVQEYNRDLYERNIQRLVQEGTRVRAVVTDKKIVREEYKGTYSAPRVNLRHRVYVKILDPPGQGKVLWQRAHPTIYEKITVGSRVNAYLKRDSIHIEELKYVEETRTTTLLIAAFIFFAVAVIAKKRANKLTQ